ncbi:MAG: hypothetical protein R3E48_23315 [Burkholderiaceae bacterium]
MLRHDATGAAAYARRHGAWLVGFNTNGIISPGQCKLGGIGGDDPAAVYHPGRIGVVSRSGGMSADRNGSSGGLAVAVSTVVSMGGDRTTDALWSSIWSSSMPVIYGEPGTRHEQGVADAIAAGRITKPVVAIVVGEFQDATARALASVTLLR